VTEVEYAAPCTGFEASLNTFMPLHLKKPCDKFMDMLNLTTERDFNSYIGNTEINYNVFATVPIILCIVISSCFQPEFSGLWRLADYF